MTDEDDLGYAFEKRKSGDVAISRHGRTVATLSGKAAVRFLERVEDGDPQQAMARVTGNYRRGNEQRAGKQSWRTDRPGTTRL